MMVRSALAGVNQANFTENYSVLRGMTTPALQARVDAAQFRRAFDGLRAQNLDLSPVLVLPPHFTTAPSLTPRGALRLVGFVPSRPLQINFAIDYRPIDGTWLIDGISVSTVRVAPLVPEAAPPVIAGFPAADTRAATNAWARVPVHPTIWNASVNTILFGPSVRRAVHPR